MRKIEKSDEPEAFYRWKEHFQNIRGRKPDYADLSKTEHYEIKQEVKQALLKEQHNLCCYCCAQLQDDKCHIEHFRPRTDYPQLSLEYDNLHISCNGKNGDSCGHKKEDWFVEGITLSPLEPSIESKFTYLQNGTIEAKDGNRDVKLNIDKLSLNEECLKIARKIMLDTSNILEAESLEELEIILDDLREMYPNDTNEIYCPFCNIIKYFAQQRRECLE